MLASSPLLAKLAAQRPGRGAESGSAFSRPSGQSPARIVGDTAAQPFFLRFLSSPVRLHHGLPPRTVTEVIRETSDER